MVRSQMSHNKVLGPSPPRRTALRVHSRYGDIVVGGLEERPRWGVTRTLLSLLKLKVTDEASATVALCIHIVWVCLCALGHRLLLLEAGCSRLGVSINEATVGEGAVGGGGLSFPSPAPQLETQAPVGALPPEHTSQGNGDKSASGERGPDCDLGCLDAWTTRSEARGDLKL